MGWKLVNLQIKHNRKLQISFFSVLMSINSCKEISIYEVKICLICTNDCKSFWMIAWADWKWLKISQFFLMKSYSSYRFSYYKKRLNVLLSLVNYDFVFFVPLGSTISQSAVQYRFYLQLLHFSLLLVTKSNQKLFLCTKWKFAFCAISRINEISAN